MGNIDPIAVYNLLWGAAIGASLASALWYAYTKRQSSAYYAEQPTAGARGQWWVGIYRNGKRVFQSAPPGHRSESEAKEAVAALGVGWKRTRSDAC